jgi:uncharacterized protein YndB with AHSA1/START domain
VRAERAQVVKAPRERVFEAWNNCEAWPRWSVAFTRGTVTERAGNTKHLVRNSESRADDPPDRKHVLTPPELVRVEGEMAGALTRPVEVRRGRRRNLADGGGGRAAR